MGVLSHLPKIGVGAIVVLGIGVIGWKVIGPGNSSAHVDVRVPELSSHAASGQTAFQENCASCHGDNASGSDKGPPLIHNIYNPGHHGDRSFFMAVQRGVRAHHWPFGNMPPQPKVTERQVVEIVRFIREVQVANGITSQPHKM